MVRLDARRGRSGRTRSGDHIGCNVASFDCPTKILMVLALRPYIRGRKTLRFSCQSQRRPVPTPPWPRRKRRPWSKLGEYRVAISSVTTVNMLEPSGKMASFSSVFILYVGSTLYSVLSVFLFYFVDGYVLWELSTCDRLIYCSRRTVTITYAHAFQKLLTFHTGRTYLFAVLLSRSPGRNYEPNYVLCY